MLSKDSDMIVKVGKGTAERPLYLVKKGLDGDMDAVNACEDKMIRAKAKAMIVKVGKGTAERPPMPETVNVNDALVMSRRIPLLIEINKDVNQKVKDMIEEKFPGLYFGK